MSSGYLLSAGLCAVTLLIFLMYIFRGRSRRPVTGEKPLPPEGISACRAGYIIDGIIDQKDVASIIIDFIGEGYVTCTGATLFKVKEMDSSEDAFRKEVFDGLFASGDSFDTRTPSRNFAASYETAVEGLHTSFRHGRKRLFTVSSTVMRYIAALLVVSACTVPCAAAGKRFIYFALLAFVLVTAGTASVIRTADKAYSMSPSSKRRRYLAGMIPVLAAAGICAYAAASSYGEFYAVFMLSAIPDIVMLPYIRKRTEEGSRIYEELLSLRDFIRHADHNTLRIVASRNDGYYMRILPYAYVFGLTDRWMKNFARVDADAVRGTTDIKTCCNNLCNGILYVLPESVIRRKDYTGFGDRGSRLF